MKPAPVLDAKLDQELTRKPRPISRRVPLIMYWVRDLSKTAATRPVDVVRHVARTRLLAFESRVRPVDFERRLLGNAPRPRPGEDQVQARAPRTLEPNHLVSRLSGSWACRSRAWWNGGS